MPFRNDLPFVVNEGDEAEIGVAYQCLASNAWKRKVTILL